MISAAILALLIQVSARQETPPDLTPSDTSAQESITPDAEAQDSASPPDQAADEEAEDTPDAPEVAPAPQPAFMQIKLPENPVQLGAYQRDYEAALSDSEARYQANVRQGVQNMMARYDLEGAWELAYGEGPAFVMLELRQDPKRKNRVDGAWRSLDNQGRNSGFLSDVTLYGSEAEINYFLVRGPTPYILHLRRQGNDLWRGQMTAPDGQTTVVTLRRKK